MPTQIHTISLNNAWQLQALDPMGDSEIAAKAGQSWSQLLPGYGGVVRYTRFFHRPTGVERAKIVLCITNLTGAPALHLNDIALEIPSLSYPVRCEISSMLLPRNQLVIEIQHDNDRGGLVGDVKLEIHEDAA